MKMEEDGSEDDFFQIQNFLLGQYPHLQLLE